MKFKIQYLWKDLTADVDTDFGVKLGKHLLSKWIHTFVINKLTF